MRLYRVSSDEVEPVSRTTCAAEGSEKKDAYFRDN